MTIVPIQTAIPIPYEAVAAFCEKHHIVKMWLFGSVLRDDFTSDSDVDVLVELDPDHIPGWEFFTWQNELGALLERDVDIGTRQSLRPQLRDRILQSAQVIYE